MMTCNWQDHLDALERMKFKRIMQTVKPDLRDIIATMKRIEAQQEQALSDLRQMIRSLERDE